MSSILLLIHLLSISISEIYPIFNISEIYPIFTSPRLILFLIALFVSAFYLPPTFLYPGTTFPRILSGSAKEYILTCHIIKEYKFIKLQLIHRRPMLTNNPTQMDSYNKHSKAGQGTLMANWFEERVHREAQGNGRAATRTHFPKKHEDLLDSQGFKGRDVGDNTKFRTLGDTQYGLGTTENYHYGKSTNKADSFPKTGKKQKLTEQMYLRQITSELEEEQRRKIEEERRGQFQTTTGSTFVAKPFDANQVGKLIMRDQNGALVGLQNVDEDLRETNGFRERGQISRDEDLRRLIDTDNGYERSQPITFWKQKMQEGTFYMSNPGKQQGFGKNNEFLKTFKHYKHNHD